MPDIPPDRLSNNPNSPFYDEAALRRGVGIRFKGVERTNVEEYCVSEGWVRVAVGKTLDRRGNPLTMKANGPVEPYFRNHANGRGVGRWIASGATRAGADLRGRSCGEAQSSAMIGLRRTPTPVISTSIVSPGFIHSGGV